MTEILVHRKCGREVEVPNRFVWFVYMFAFGGSLIFMGALLFMFIIGIPLLAIGALLVLMSFIAPFGMRGWRLCSKCPDFWSPSDDHKKVRTA